MDSCQDMAPPDAMFLVRQLQGKYLHEKCIYFAFVNLEKAVDRVPWNVVWLEMCKLRGFQALCSLCTQMQEVLSMVHLVSEESVVVGWYSWISTQAFIVHDGT